jgi:hypothetical protein
VRLLLIYGITLSAKYDKLHGRVIVVIKDDVPHAWSFGLYLALIEEIETGFLNGSIAVWILL